MGEIGGEKRCTQCQQDVSQQPRWKDAGGAYFCAGCWAGRTSATAVPVATEYRVHRTLRGKRIIDLHCPHCSQEAEVPLEEAGRPFDCPLCRNPMIIPASRELGEYQRKVAAEAQAAKVKIEEKQLRRRATQAALQLRPSTFLPDPSTTPSAAPVEPLRPHSAKEAVAFREAGDASVCNCWYCRQPNSQTHVQCRFCRQLVSRVRSSL